MTKTPDETKKGLADPIHVHYHPGDFEPRLTPLTMCDLEAMHADALALIQQLEAQVPRWISVEERLPVEGQMVAFIPSCNSGSVYVGVLANIGKSGGVMFSHREGRYKSNYYAKYWMPLPEMKEETP